MFKRFGDQLWRSSGKITALLLLSLALGFVFLSRRIADQDRDFMVTVGLEQGNALAEEVGLFLDVLLKIKMEASSSGGGEALRNPLGENGLSASNGLQNPTGLKWRIHGIEQGVLHPDAASDAFAKEAMAHFMGHTDNLRGNAYHKIDDTPVGSASAWRGGGIWTQNLLSNSTIPGRV